MGSWGIVVVTGHLVGLVIHEGWVDGAAAKQWWSPLCRWFANLVASRPSARQDANCPGKPSRQHDQQICDQQVASTDRPVNPSRQGEGTRTPDTSAGCRR